MTARRIMGTEVEYGISVPGDPTANPVITSTQVVLAYAAAADIPRSRRARWDYEVESPLRDARGFDLSAPTLHNPVDSELDDLGAANVILTNGARLYVDHAHPEFSTPEVTTPRDVVIWDKAGERVMEEAAMRAATVPGAPRIQLYKNNVDGKGASYGSHENYLMARQTTFPSIVAGLTPFFVTRQVVCGAGRVGRGASGDEAGYQISQRADYIEVEVGLETTLKRGIINTRDEPHADADKYRRLHVIIGDANMSEYSTLLKVGTAALVLDMIEAGVRFDELRLAEPVRSVHRISHDPSLKLLVDTVDGRKLTALDVQRVVLREGAASTSRTRSAPTSTRPRPRCSTIWGQVLDDLARDPLSTADRLDWTAKLRLLEGYRERDGLTWDAPAAAPGRPAVHRRAHGQGPVQPARHPRLDQAAGHRGAGHGRDDHAAGGHPRLLPRPLPRALPGRGRRRLLGFGDLRPGPGVAGADPHPGAAARHPAPRRRADRQLRAPPRNW